MDLTPGPEAMCGESGTYWLNGSDEPHYTAPCELAAWHEAIADGYLGACDDAAAVAQNGINLGRSSSGDEQDTESSPEVDRA